MEWQDQGIVLSARPHGESGLIVTALTPQRGLVRGWMRLGKKERGLCQQGSFLQLRWRARVVQSLGRFQAEFVSNPLLSVFEDRLRFTAVSTYLTFLSDLLAENHPYPVLWQSFHQFLEILKEKEWLYHYVHLEKKLLGEIGFGLNLSRCAVTGQTENLTHVSPRTGRSVCKKEAAPYVGKLLILPDFLREMPQNLSPVQEENTLFREEILQGLALTGYFLKQAYSQQREQELPLGRAQLERFIEKWHVNVTEIKKTASVR